MTQTYPATLYDRSFDTRTLVTARIGPSTVYIQQESSTLEWKEADLDDARQLDDGSVVLQKGNLFLEVLEPGFATTLLQAFENKKLFHRPFFDRIGLKGCLIALLILLIPLLAVYLWVVPLVAERGSQYVSPEIEKQIGASWYQNIIQEHTVDTSKSRLVQSFYDSLHYGVGYDVQISVVREPVVNAFAIPGGRIVVFDGMLGVMTAPEQLAALLAHEASHIQFRHSVHAIFRELSNQLFISIMLGEYGSYGNIVAQHASKLAGLSYSRDLEWEADEQGMQLMQYNGIPLRGMPDLFRNMQAGQDTNTDVPTFLSTHPALEERLAAADQRASADSTAQYVAEAVQQIWREIKQ
ncbi:MAG: M48 family metallopeptidase [Bacteroidetes bacterium]|nr:MAG: M48 family metallopeptidase [Bacteroidota bacterium]